MKNKFVEYLEDGQGLPASTAHMHDVGDDLMVVYDEEVSQDFLPSPAASDEVDVKEVGKELSDLLEDDDLADLINDFTTEYAEEVSPTVMVPGTNHPLEEEEPPLEIEKDWLNDKDPGTFMDYISGSYPDGIPQHDGQSMIGCERAILYLSRLNKEISEALRLDSNDALDPHVLEDYRVKIMRDVVTLKTRLSELKTKLNQSTRDKTAFYDGDLVKEATTPRLQIVVTPFERAVAGIIVNSVVSGGKPFEDVYSFLKDKYALDEREELSVMQILMDGGYHIFKDRGVIGSSNPDAAGNPSQHGVEFIKNYFG